MAVGMWNLSCLSQRQRHSHVQRGSIEDRPDIVEDDTGRAGWIDELEQCLGRQGSIAKAPWRRHLLALFGCFHATGEYLRSLHVGEICVNCPIARIPLGGLRNWAAVGDRFQTRQCEVTESLGLSLCVTETAC